MKIFPIMHHYLTPAFWLAVFSSTRAYKKYRYFRMENKLQGGSNQSYSKLKGWLVSEKNLRHVSRIFESYNRVSNKILEPVALGATFIWN